MRSPRASTKLPRASPARWKSAAPGAGLPGRHEESSAETSRAVLDASKRLTTSLNFKTGHVHDEFVDLADRVHEMLNERIDRITSEFEQRSSPIVDGISDRTEQFHDSLKNSSD